MDNEERLAIVRRKYGDILDEPRPRSAFPHATMEQRAALFMPFDALTGYDDAIEEVDRTTKKGFVFGEDDYRTADLDAALERLRETKNPKIKVIFFLEDEKKSGGQYLSYCGVLRRIDEVERLLIFKDGTKIALPLVYSINFEDEDGD